MLFFLEFYDVHDGFLTSVWLRNKTSFWFAHFTAVFVIVILSRVTIFICQLTANFVLIYLDIASISF